MLVAARRSGLVRYRAPAAPAATAWTPANDAATLAWFDPTTGVATSGSAVTSWTDRVKAIAATQATAANQPTMTANGIGGRPSLVFAGGAQFLAAAGLVGNAPGGTFTIAAVAACTGFGNGACTLLGPSATGGVPARYENSYGATTTNASILRAGQSSVGQSSGKIGQTATILVFSYDGSSAWSIRANGASIGSGTSTGNTFAATTAIIGQNGANNGEGFVGQLGDLVVTNDASLSVQQKLEGDFAWKYGLQASLPSAHPYNARAPLTSDP